ncbi:hypothetical protein FB45DRAFT_1051469 [Roridomyces roridus]|uniref:AAA-ATPase-like domain-containing protein n=1 Tax=Roridomyces roridus TaxID=1738132 RepID=A0AAD7CEH5_9AGAR|nr:hypothetical protein FB45DRAFT_1051469 [Roridomyces roridus]
MPDQADPNATYTYECLFFEKAHQTEFKPWTLTLTRKEIDKLGTVADFFQIVQHKHNVSSCQSCAGPILIKCSCRVYWLNAVAKEHWRLQDVELKHKPDDGMHFMPPYTKITPHLHFGSVPAGTIRFIFECTFDVPKRKRQDEEDSNKKSKEMPIPQPLGLRVLRSSEDSATPMSILPRACSIFPDHTAFDNRVLADKTRYIPIVDSFLRARKRGGCVVSLPKGVGKSTFLKMLLAFYNCQNSTFDETFEDFAIREMVHTRVTEHKYHWGAKKGLCLVFDLRGIGEVGGTGSEVSRSIKAYVRNTFEQFVDGYRHEFKSPVVLPARSGKDGYSAAAMLRNIKAKVSWTERRLFVAVDHWDDVIQRCIACSNTAAIDDITRALTVFLTDLAKESHPEINILLLILGNLPPTVEGVTPNSVVNISTESNLQGAFGMTDQELEDFFRVLSWGRRTKLSTRDPNLAHTLGRFEPAAYSPTTPTEAEKKSSVPLPIYNFTLVLHYSQCF